VISHRKQSQGWLSPPLFAASAAACWFRGGAAVIFIFSGFPTLRAAFRRRLHLSLQMVLLYYLAFLVAIRGGSNAVYSFSNFILWKSVFFYTFCW